MFPWIAGIVLASISIILIWLGRREKILEGHTPKDAQAYAWWNKRQHWIPFAKTKEILEATGYEGHWSVFIIRSLIISIAVGIVCGMLLGSFITFLMCTVIGLIFCYHRKFEAYNEVLKRSDEDFLTLLETFTIHYKDYGNINAALSSMVNDLNNSLQYPSQVLANALESGETIEQALERFYKVTKNRWALAYGTLLLTNYYQGGDIIQAFRDLMDRIRNSITLQERKRASQAGTTVTMYIGIISQPVLLLLSSFITEDFLGTLFTTKFGISMINTVLLIDIISYIIIRNIQSRGLYNVH